MKKSWDEFSLGKVFRKGSNLILHTMISKNDIILYIISCIDGILYVYNIYIIYYMYNTLYGCVLYTI